MATANAGRTPAPASLRILQGNGRGRDSGNRQVKEPPNFVRLPPDAPASLGPHAAAEWERVVPALSRLSLLKPIDRAGLTCYCELWETFVRATADVHERGLVVENKSVKKDGTETIWFTANPAVAVQLKAQAAIRAWCAEFGLTPSAESKVSAPEANSGSNNPFAG